MALDGSPNPWTIHEGMPVESGSKYIVTKWYRERPVRLDEDLRKSPHGIGRVVGRPKLPGRSQGNRHPLYQRRRIDGRDAPDRHAGNFEQGRPPRKNGRLGAIVGRLRRGRIEGAECNIVRARFASLHCQVPAVVTGLADLCRGPKKSPRLRDFAIALAKMHPIGAKTLGERHVVVDDERNAGVRTDALQRFSKPRQFIIPAPLTRSWKAAAAPGSSAAFS